MHTMCPRGYHNHGLMATPEPGHRMYGYTYITVIHIYMYGYTHI